MSGPIAVASRAFIASTNALSTRVAQIVREDASIGSVC
jgi:hypothetical protein